MTARTAVVLMNLGGPDRLEAVQPFLFNLFNDPAILRLPGPVRWLLATLLSRKRAPVAREIYAHLGGGSPLLANTEAQAAAVDAALGEGAKTFIAMRYWHPRALDTARAVKAWAPDRVLLLPLYPHFSTTTTASSVADWHRAAGRVGLTAPTQVVCCYPEDPGFIAALAESIRAAWQDAAAAGRPRLLFSAHGLPKRVVDQGDPYPSQIERTAAAVVEQLRRGGLEDLDWAISYQSRVGPLEWIGPSTDAEVARAGADRVPLVVCPIAFVSDHSETLVEIEVEYRRLAVAKGVPAFIRVPAVGTAEAFIDGLARLVAQALQSEAAVCPGAGHRTCRAGSGGCPMRS